MVVVEWLRLLAGYANVADSLSGGGDHLDNY